jgi:hypothetical protein
LREDRSLKDLPRLEAATGAAAVSAA